MPTKGCDDVRALRYALHQLLLLLLVRHLLAWQVVDGQKRARRVGHPLRCTCVLLHHWLVLLRLLHLQPCWRPLHNVGLLNLVAVNMLLLLLLR
jgi:hypothetical protein